MHQPFSVHKYILRFEEGVTSERHIKGKQRWQAHATGTWRILKKVFSSVGNNTELMALKLIWICNLTLSVKLVILGKYMRE